MSAIANLIDHDILVESETASGLYFPADEWKIVFNGHIIADVNVIATNRAEICLNSGPSSIVGVDEDLDLDLYHLVDYEF